MIAKYDEYPPITLSNRTYLPYFFITNCEKCGAELHEDYTEDNYLMNPVVGRIVSIHFYCNRCKRDQYEEAKLEIVITPVGAHKPVYRGKHHV